MVALHALFAALPLVSSHRIAEQVSEEVNLPCDQCAQIFEASGGCESLRRDGDVSDSAIPDGCAECGDAAWELCMGEDDEVDDAVCDQCAQDVSAAGGCNALIHEGDLPDDSIPEGCDACGDSVYDFCCDDCVERFEQAGGCEFMLSGEDLSDAVVPSGCQFCSDAAYDSCTLDAPSFIQKEGEAHPRHHRHRHRRHRRHHRRQHGWHGHRRNGWHRHNRGWHGRNRGHHGSGVHVHIGFQGSR